MNEYDIKRLALILAVQAEIEGMKAENLKKEFDNKPPYYDRIPFNFLAEELRNLAYKHNEQL